MIKLTKLYGHISNWDTSLVTDMNNLFKGLIYFNEECPHICTGEILTITNGLINTPNLTSDNLTTLINVL